MRKNFRYLGVILGLLGTAAAGSAQDENYVLKREQSEVAATSITLSPDGAVLLAGYDDGSFRLLDPESYALILEVKEAHPRAVNAMDMHPNMDLILSAGASSIKLWNRKGEHLLDWNAHATTIWNAEISPDGSWALSSAINKTFLLWDLKEKVLAEKMRGHSDVAMAACFSPDNHMIASGSNDQTIRLWDLESRQVIQELHGPTQGIFDIKFSPDGNLLAVCSKDKSVRIYDLRQEQQLHILQGHSDMVLEAEFSPDGSYLLSASADQSIILWDVNSGEKIHQFLDNPGAVTDLVFHPDGCSFYSISYGKDLTHRSLDPKIFVLRYYEKPYRDALAGNPLFDPRRKGESKKDYQAREQKAGLKEREIITLLYEEYLSDQNR